MSRCGWLSLSVTHIRWPSFDGLTSYLMWGQHLSQPCGSIQWSRSGFEFGLTSFPTMRFNCVVNFEFEPIVSGQMTFIPSIHFLGSRTKSFSNVVDQWTVITGHHTVVISGILVSCMSYNSSCSVIMAGFYGHRNGTIHHDLRFFLSSGIFSDSDHWSLSLQWVCCLNFLGKSRSIILDFTDPGPWVIIVSFS